MKKTFTFVGMDIQAEKLGLIQWLTQLTDESVIAKIKALRNEKADWWEEISSEEKIEIQEGLLQADRGELKSHAEVRKKYEKLALKIVWTPRAEKGFEKVIAYLKENWTEREVQNFMRESFRFFELLTEHPEILEKSTTQKNLYRGPMDSHNILTYRIKPRKKQIELMNIRSSKQKP